MTSKGKCESDRSLRFGDNYCNDAIICLGGFFPTMVLQSRWHTISIRHTFRKIIFWKSRRSKKWWLFPPNNNLQSFVSSQPDRDRWILLFSFGLVFFNYFLGDAHRLKFESEPHPTKIGKIQLDSDNSDRRNSVYAWTLKVWERKGRMGRAKHSGEKGTGGMAIFHAKGIRYRHVLGTFQDHAIYNFWNLKIDLFDKNGSQMKNKLPWSEFPNRGSTISLPLP